MYTNPLYQYDEVTDRFLEITNTFSLTQLQAFISSLPSHLSSLDITNRSYLRRNLDDYSLCCPDNLYFSHFTNLQKLNFGCGNNTLFFNVSIFPETLETFDYLSANVLTGHFPSNLITLNVDLSCYDESVTYFFNMIITLNNLVTLRIRISHYESVDLREARFPSRLCSFYETHMAGMDYSTDPNKVGTRYIVLDAIPTSLNHFSLVDDCMHMHIIVIDGSKGENIASMKRQISFGESFVHMGLGYIGRNWIQYSCFDEEESIIDSLCTLFVV
ncbi:unnamed protein product [Ambrosiozyma monospora]|uniref:Unnamed protein product n=1 Tax=Ambrosiozyma monospora TaxID=43982 RepID=A0ACB5SS30_AMBMO|nr:unnamed protein product [Ambrosiozyma monospora]